jgi:hypothetical protein
VRYREIVTAAAINHIDESRPHARAALDRAKAEAAQLERTAAAYEWLLELAGEPSSAATDLTLHEAMVDVLEKAPLRMMRAGDLAAEIEHRRPVEAQQIHARVGHYPNLFAKEGTLIKLAEPR